MTKFTYLLDTPDDLLSKGEWVEKRENDSIVEILADDGYSVCTLLNSIHPADARFICVARNRMARALWESFRDDAMAVSPHYSIEATAEKPFEIVLKDDYLERWHERIFERLQTLLDAGVVRAEKVEAQP